jgi:hypothetical protein
MVATLAAVALAFAAPTTHDVLPIFLGDRGPVYLYYFDLRSPSLASALRVFHERRAFRDLLPRGLVESLDVYDNAYELDRARLLASNGTTRLYGIPQPGGGLCFYDQIGVGYCVIRLLHRAAYPFVDARRGRVFGLLSDDVVRVDVRFAKRSRRAKLGRNAFIATGSRPRSIVATDRDGGRHVYTFFPCEVIDGTDFMFERIVERPLDPLPDYCG